MDTRSPATADALANLYDAGAVRVPPWLAVVAGLASVRPDGIGATVDWLVEHRDELERAYAEGRDARLALATLPRELQYEPELGGLDRTRDDHRLRDRWVFADIVGRLTFFQAAVYAITGLELSLEDAQMLEVIGTVNLTVERGVWPLAVTRRVAARGGGCAAAVAAGVAMMGSPVLAGAAAADCARFLLRARAWEDEGRPVSDLVDDILGRRERVMGFGRPIVGYDERVPVMEQILARYGRDRLPHVTTLRAAEAAFKARKGLTTTAAAWAAAILLDLGMSPDAVMAVSNHWVAVNVQAQALFATERGEVR